MKVKVILLMKSIRKRQLHPGARGAIAPPPKNCESNFIQHDFLQFEIQRMKTNSEQVFGHGRIVLLFAI